MQLAGRILFCSMLAIHFFCFVIPRWFPPASIVVAALGFVGILLALFGGEQNKSKKTKLQHKTLYSHPLEEELYRSHVETETLDFDYLDKTPPQ